MANYVNIGPSGVLILAGTYLFAVSNPNVYSKKDLAENVHSTADASAVTFAASSGTTGGLVDLTPYTTVDKRFYNVDADLAKLGFSSWSPPKLSPLNLSIDNIDV